MSSAKRWLGTLTPGVIVLMMVYSIGWEISFLSDKSHILTLQGLGGDPHVIGEHRLYIGIEFIIAAISVYGIYRLNRKSARASK